MRGDYDGGAAEMVRYDESTGQIERMGAAKAMAWDRIREDPDAETERLSDLTVWAPYTGLYRVTDEDGAATYYMRAEGLGAHMRLARTAAGLSQQALGDAIGSSQPEIADWERGRREPRVSTLIAIADALGVTLDDLVGRSVET